MAVLRALLRWTPAAVAAAVLVVAVVQVLAIEAPPSTSPPEQPAAASDTPVLSLRRNLDPLRELAALGTLRAELDRFVGTQPEDTCLQVEVDTLRYEHRVDDPQTPASLQKLLTAVAALTELGPEETFETDVLSGPVTGGVVTGNLYLRGGGDPVLATPAYVARERNQPQIHTNIDVLAGAVVAAGVTTVTGSVVGDESRYDTERYNPELPSRFIAQGQVGPISALSMNDGFAHFPDQTGVFGPAPDPAAYAATVFRDALEARGVAFGGPPAAGPTPDDAAVLASVTSPPVTAIVTQLLQESDNNTAEMLLKEIGLRREGEGSFAAGRRAVAVILDETGIDVSGAAVVDGSGLAAENAVTCDLVLELLAHAPTSERVRSSLAVAGESGTLARRWSDSPAAGRIRAKTGSLNTVTALAGYAETAAGEPASFALVVNVPPGAVVGPETILAQQQLAEALVAYPRLPDVDELRPAGGGG